MPVPTCSLKPVPDNNRKRKMTSKPSHVVYGIRDKTEIEESTLTESHFDFPMKPVTVMAQVNPSYHSADLMESVLSDLQETGLISSGSNMAKKRNAWTSLKMDLLTCLTSPHTSYPHIRVYMLWMALVYSVDDIRDKFLLEHMENSRVDTNKVDIHTFLKIVKSTNKDVLKMADSETNVLPKLSHFKPCDPVVKLTRLARQQSLEVMGRAAYDEFVTYLEDHLCQGVTQAIKHVVAMQCGEAFPLSIEEFEELRKKDAAGEMCIHLAGGVYYGQCEDQEVLRRCMSITALHAAILNDIFSFEKQIYREKDRFNYICGVQDLRGVSFDEAAHLSVQRANELVREHQVLAAQVDPEDKVAQSILDTHRRWFGGHLAWVKECGRYSSETSPFSFLRATRSTMDSSLSPGT